MSTMSPKAARFRAAPPALGGHMWPARAGLERLAWRAGFRCPGRIHHLPPGRE